MSKENSYWQSYHAGYPVDTSPDAMRGAAAGQRDKPHKNFYDTLSEEQKRGTGKELLSIIKTACAIFIGIPLLHNYVLPIYDDVIGYFTRYFNNEKNATHGISPVQSRTRLTPIEIKPEKPLQTRTNDVLSNHLAINFNKQDIITQEAPIQVSYKALSSAIRDPRHRKVEGFMFSQGNFTTYFEREYAQQKDAPPRPRYGENYNVRSLFCIENAKKNVLHLSFITSTSTEVSHTYDKISKYELVKMKGCENGLETLRERIQDYGSPAP